MDVPFLKVNSISAEIPHNLFFNVTWNIKNGLGGTRNKKEKFSFVNEARQVYNDRFTVKNIQILTVNCLTPAN